MSRYAEVYASWQKDPEAFWAEAAKGVEWHRTWLLGVQWHPELLDDALAATWAREGR